MYFTASNMSYVFIPRERGTRIGQDRGIVDRRFIPTRAGNTYDMLLAVKYMTGSSPRERGTLSAAAGAPRQSK